MTARISIAVAAAAATVALVAAPSASAGSFAACGDHIVNGGGWYNLRAKVVSCDVASQIAEAYVFSADHSPKGFDCGETQIADEVWKVKCSKDTASHGRQKLKFRYGA